MFIYEITSQDEFWFEYNDSICSSIPLNIKIWDNIPSFSSFKTRIIIDIQQN